MPKVFSPRLMHSDSEVASLLERLVDVKKFQGRLVEGPDIFIQAMEIVEEISHRAAKVQVYATMSSAVDATDQQGAAMNGKATSALAQVSAATSFVDPELLSIGEHNTAPMACQMIRA